MSGRGSAIRRAGMFGFRRPKGRGNAAGGRTIAPRRLLYSICAFRVLRRRLATSRPLPTRSQVPGSGTTSFSAPS